MVLLFVLGIYLMPTTSFACSMKSYKNCSEKVTTSKLENKDCCEKDKNCRNKDHKGCDGSCKHISCNRTVINLGLPLLYDANTINQDLCFLSEKQNFYYSKVFIPSYFQSIKLPPKIS